VKNVFLASVIILTTVSAAFGGDVKEASLAGSWYPSSKTELESMMQGYLDAANPPKIDGRLFAIISPHAGLRFSGPIAAYGFKAAMGRDIKTVILIGFSHRKPFDGISVYNKGSFRTPIGEISVDASLADAIMAGSPRTSFIPSVFDEENSIELQLPFIQTAFKGAMIVPIAFGTQDYEDAVSLSAALERALKGRKDYIIVASTDMSHYHSYDAANSMDRITISLVEGMKARDIYDECMMRTSELCGVMPVVSTLLAAGKLGFNDTKILKYANSGDTYGDKDRVVGYMSAVVYSSTVSGKSRASEKGDERMLNDAQRKRLLTIARESITSFVMDGKRKKFTEDDPLLSEPMGAFVTLHERGELRGCIGNMVGRGPLYQTVADMAIEAATDDPRFQALSPKELSMIDLEISVLSPLKRVSSADEIKIPGHGVIVRKGFASGVYLPQVATETGWNKEQFLTSLCGQKAGISSDAWKDPATELYVFTAEVFGEKEKKDER
jgi:hypothetical protein